MRTYVNDELAALDEVEDLLEAYAHARYAPASPVLARMRRQVLAQASRTAAAASVRTSDPAAPGQRSRPVFRLARTGLALVGAAALVLAMSTAVLGAPPNSPFYNARVALQEAFLPAQADARFAGREALLTERLAEAEGAVVQGDAVGLEAALAAYQAEIDTAVAEVGDEPDRLDHFEEVLDKHVAKLLGLAARLPNQTAKHNALQHAIDASERAAKKLREKGSHGGGNPLAPPGQLR